MKMRKINIIISVALSSMVWFGCAQKPSMQKTDTVASANKFGGFATQVAWGQHLVALGGCGDCHTPKKMTAMGPVPDMSMFLAGHPSGAPTPQVDRKDIESKGLIVTNDLTAWVGPWGVSYTANLTPDETGIGNWTEQQFIKAIREGKFQGLDGTRPLMPPMSFVAEGLAHSTSDAELAAIFAYLKTIKPVHNVVPQPQPPMMAMKH